MMLKHVKKISYDMICEVIGFVTGMCIDCIMLLV